MKRCLVLLTISTFIFFSCVNPSKKADSLNPNSPERQSITSKGWGAALIGAVGATAGAIFDKKNRWRGAAIGGALGAITGVALADVADRAAKKAAQTNRQVIYTNNQTRQRVVATPTKIINNRCKEIVVIIYEGDKEISRQTDEKCI